MCGRSRVSGAAIAYASHLTSESPRYLDGEALSGNEKVYDAETGLEFQSCENCMPGRATPIVVGVTGSVGDSKDLNKQLRSLKRARWGLIPSYTKAGTKLDFFRMNNARVERVDQVHRNSIKKNLRCVVVVDGFYEWKTNADPYSASGKVKQPYFIHRKDGKPLMFCGLYAYYYPSEKEKVATYTIVTVPVNKDLEWLHHRMPAVLPDVDAALKYLHEPDWSSCKRYLVPENKHLLHWHPVSTKVNKTTYQGEDCSKAIVLKSPKSISSFFGKAKTKVEKTENKQQPESQSNKANPPKLSSSLQADTKPLLKRKAETKARSPQKDIASFFKRKK